MALPQLRQLRQLRQKLALLVALLVALWRPLAPTDAHRLEFREARIHLSRDKKGGAVTSKMHLKLPQLVSPLLQRSSHTRRHAQSYHSPVSTYRHTTSITEVRKLNCL